MLNLLLIIILPDGEKVGDVSGALACRGQLVRLGSSTRLILTPSRFPAQK